MPDTQIQNVANLRLPRLLGCTPAGFHTITGFQPVTSNCVTRWNWYHNGLFCVHYFEDIYLLL